MTTSYRILLLRKRHRAGTPVAWQGGERAHGHPRAVRSVARRTKRRREDCVGVWQPCGSAQRSQAVARACGSRCSGGEPPTGPRPFPTSPQSCTPVHGHTSVRVTQANCGTSHTATHGHARYVLHGLCTSLKRPQAGIPAHVCCTEWGRQFPYASRSQPRSHQRPPQPPSCTAVRRTSAATPLTCTEHPLTTTFAAPRHGDKLRIRHVQACGTHVSLTDADSLSVLR